MFLTRMLAHANCDWVLKGDTSILLRIGSGQRSRDIGLDRREQALRQKPQALVKEPGSTDSGF